MAKKKKYKKKNKVVEFVDKVADGLLVFGGLNIGILEFLDFNMVSDILGKIHPTVGTVTIGLITASGLWKIGWAVKNQFFD